MKKRGMKLMGLLLAAALLVSGCGNSGNIAKNSDGDTKSETKTEKTSLVFWSVGLKLKDDSGQKTPEELAANRYIKQFETDHPGVTVEVIDQPVDAIHDLFKAANISQEGPDVVGLWSGTSTNEYKENLLALDSYLTEDEISSYTGLDLCRKDFKNDGEIIALPYNLTTYNVFYNKEYFKQAGIDESQLPTNWEEFLAVCEQLKAADIQPLLIGDSSGESTTWVSSEFMADQVGPEKIVEFGTEGLPYSGAEYKNALTTWKDLFDHNYTNKDFSSLSAWDSIQRFVMGEGAMNINGSWAIGEMYPIMDENLGTFKIPAISADASFGDYIISQPGANVSVTAYSKNKDLAVEFIKYMTSKEFEGEAHLDTGDLPANNQVDASVINNPISQTAFSWIQENKAVIGYDSLIPVEASSELYKLAPTLCSGKLTVDDLIKKLEAIQ